MKVDVQVEPAAEALNDRDSAGVAVADAIVTCPPSQEAQQHAYVDREHSARELVIPREEIAKTVGQAQHPLPDGDARCPPASGGPYRIDVKIDARRTARRAGAAR